MHISFSSSRSCYIRILLVGFFFIRPLQIYANSLMPIKYFHENEELLRPKSVLLFILGTSYSFHISSPNDACAMYSIVLTKHIIILYSFALWCMVCVCVSQCVYGYSQHCGFLNNIHHQNVYNSDIFPLMRMTIDGVHVHTHVHVARQTIYNLSECDE